MLKGEKRRKLVLLEQLVPPLPPELRLPPLQPERRGKRGTRRAFSPAGSAGLACLSTLQKLTP